MIASVSEAGSQRKSRSSREGIEHAGRDPRGARDGSQASALESHLPQAYSFPGLQVRFEPGGSRMVLRGSAITATAGSSSRRELINRLFSVPALQSLRLNWKRGEARLEFHGSAPQLRRLSKLALAMQTPRPLVLPLAHEALILGGNSPSAFHVSRCPAGLTLWHIQALSRRHFRLIHPALRDDFIREQVLHELSTLPDVASRATSFPFWGSDSIKVSVDPHRVSFAIFPDALDPVITRCVAAGRPRHAFKVRDAIVHANLMLAPISDFVFPPLRAVNVLFTALLQGSKVPRAFGALRQGQVTSELLSVYVALLAIVTMEFLPAAMVYWLMRFWPRRASQAYHLHHTRFLARYRLRPRRVWTESGDAEVEAEVEELTPSRTVTLTAGDIVPGDGVIVAGTAQLDERLLTGDERERRLAKGSAIYASTRLLEGSLRVKIGSLGEDTAAGRIARWHRQALQRRDFDSRTKPLADRMALPTLLASAIGLLGGGLSLAKETSRPDYITGPAVAETLDSLKTIIRAANRGILLAGNAPLEKLSGPACVVIDTTVAWMKPDSGGPLFADLARSKGISETVFFGTGAEASTEAMAASLGFDRFAANTTAAMKCGYIAKKQKEGKVVIYVGDTLAEPVVASRADVAISVLELPFPGLQEAPLAILRPDLLKFLALRDIAAAAIKESQNAFRIGLIPNCATVLAAFFVPMPFYASLLLINAGVAANYFLSKAQLRKVEAKHHTPQALQQ